MDAIYICLASQIDTICLYTKQFITEYFERIKFNAHSGDLFTESPRGQIELHEGQIKSNRHSLKSNPTAFKSNRKGCQIAI